MINISITTEIASFYSNVSQSEITANLFEPKWERNDDNSFSLYTEQGIFNITIADYSLNKNKFAQSDDALTYLNNL
jgi:hypothetical protein